MCGSIPDDPGTVHPGLPVHPPPAAGLRRRLPRGPVRLEEAMPLLLPAAAAGHNDSQPGSHRVDNKGHEFHSGEYRVSFVPDQDAWCYLRNSPGPKDSSISGGFPHEGLDRWLH